MATQSGVRASALQLAVPLGGVLMISLLGWAWLLTVARGLQGDAMMGMSAAAHGGPVTEGAFTFVMWFVMMVAMMTPTAAPLVLTFHHLTPKQRSGLTAATASLLAGYLLAWAGFSLLATALQATLRSAGLLTPALLRAAPQLAGILLLLAGAYQLTHLKDVCLSACRSPSDFLMTKWRDGMRGALMMGWRHGLHCVGCCWSLMLLLFVAGVMNLAWVALLAVFVLIEKNLPIARRVTRAAGVLMIGTGGWILLTHAGARLW